MDLPAPVLLTNQINTIMIRTKFYKMKTIQQSTVVLAQLRKDLIREISAMNNPLKPYLEGYSTERLIANSHPLYRNTYEQEYAHYLKLRQREKEEGYETYKI